MEQTQTDVAAQSFEDFMQGNEARLRQALTATAGSALGREAAAEALSYGWEHWDRVRQMNNPMGYLYVVGRNHARRSRPRRQPPVLMRADPVATPWIEPKLAPSLERLPKQQRIVVMLLHSFQWTMTEVAEVLGVSKSTVQKHAERGMERLRNDMGVNR